MKNTSIRERKRAVVYWPIITSLTVAAFLILPGVAYDPTNLPRLLSIALIAALIFPQLIRVLILRLRGHLMSPGEGVLLAVILSYGAWAFVSSVLNVSPAIQDFLGSFGRSTGLLAYFSLFCLFLWAFYTNSFVDHRVFATSLGAIFHLTNCYLIMQFFGIDPVDWENPFGSNLLGTVGNPNFSSMLSAIAALYFSSRVLYWRSQTNKALFSDGLGALSSCLLTLLNPSTQGLFALCICLALQLVLKTQLRIRLILILSGAGLSILGLVCLSIVILSGKYLSIPALAENLTFRIIAWNASIRLIKDFPIFGTGFDTFGSWFTEYRDLESSKIFSESNYADAVHNIFLDQGVSGGVPLFALYLTFFVLVTFFGLRFSLKEDVITREYLFLLSAWIAYCLFQIVSINQLSLATFGFVLGGLLTGRSLNIRLMSARVVTSRRYLTLALAIAVALIPIQALRKDITYLNAISSGDGLRVIKAASMWPPSDFFYARTSNLLYSNNFSDLGRVEAKKALMVNPRNVIALKLLIKDSELSSLEKSKLLQILKVMDPFGFETLMEKN
jgi:O-antigen ligase